jgi:hypothetical protein
LTFNYAIVRATNYLSLATRKATFSMTPPFLLLLSSRHMKLLLESLFSSPFSSLWLAPSRARRHVVMHRLSNKITVDRTSILQGEHGRLVPPHSSLTCENLPMDFQDTKEATAQAPTEDSNKSC